MNQYRATDGDRLDIIIYKAYQSVDIKIVDAVMQENEHLQDRSVLSAGDVVFLPEIEITQNISRSKALWQ